MNAVLLAGGKGTRLYPLSAAMPKSLLPLAGVPVIDRLISQLRHAGVEDVAVATGHMSARIQKHLGTGRAHGVRIHYLEEERPLDTAGCLGQLELPPGPFLLVNADVVTDLRFNELFEFHRRLDVAATVAVRRHRVSLDFGVMQTDDDGNMQSYTEKPNLDFWIGMGIYCFSPRACESVEPGESISMPQLLLRLRETGESVRGYRTHCNWFDIGCPESYCRAEEYCRSQMFPDALSRAA